MERLHPAADAEKVAASRSHGSRPAHEVVARASLERHRQRPEQDDRGVQERVQPEVILQILGVDFTDTVRRKDAQYALHRPLSVTLSACEVCPERSRGGSLGTLRDSSLRLRMTAAKGYRRKELVLDVQQIES